VSGIHLALLGSFSAGGVYTGSITYTIGTAGTPGNGAQSGSSGGGGAAGGIAYYSFT